MFRVTITEVNETDEKETKRFEQFEQSVEVLDLRRVIDAINYKPRVYTKRAKKGSEQV